APFGGNMNWAILVVAGLFEIGWAIGLKYTEGFTRLWPSVATGLSMLISVWLLGIAMKTLPVGTAYAVWVGIGAMGTVVLGILLFDDPASPLRLISLLLIGAGIVGLILASGLSCSARRLLSGAPSMADNPLIELYRDDWLLAVHKPAGLLVHRSPIDRHETEFALQYARQLNGGAHVYPCHRLDRPTSGLLLFARDPDTASAFGKALMAGQVQKSYLALVRG